MSKIAKFKLDTFSKIKADTLDSEHKLDLLIEETTKFNKQMEQEAPGVTKGFHNLILTVGLLIAVELGFLILKRKRTAS